MLAATMWLVSQGELTVAGIFGRGMVLQRECAAPLWGTGVPGREVRVDASWSAQDEVAIVAADGSWRIGLTTPAAGGPHTVRIASGAEIVLDDVWSGEVWLCSGQSNMEWKIRPGHLGGVLDAEQVIAAATQSRIRCFEVPNQTSLRPERDVRGAWRTCSPSTAGEFSAVAYFFARELERELDVPIGIVDATWSGSRIEAWLDADAARSLECTRAALAAVERARADTEARAASMLDVDPSTVTSLHNGMLAPLVPFALRGFLWYQGESNRGNARDYVALQTAMVERWRASWGGDTEPFYFVQIAPFAYANDRGQTGALRDAQRLCLRQPNTGMVSTLDAGDPGDIHPKNKQEVGRRLALWALARTYGRSELVHSGPLFESASFDGGRARVTFQHASGGLVSGGDHLVGFEIAGEDRKFVRAMAHIEGESVVVFASDVPRPVAVRYGFQAAVQPILFNKSWLPAAAFRSDAWPIE
jgi:sialate O-acetylesterase